MRIYIQWIEFMLDKDCNTYVEIFDLSNKMGPFCGDLVPSFIPGNSNEMILKIYNFNKINNKFEFIITFIHELNCEYII